MRASGLQEEVETQCIGALSGVICTIRRPQKLDLGSYPQAVGSAYFHMGWNLSPIGGEPRDEVDDAFSLKPLVTREA